MTHPSFATTLPQRQQARALRDRMDKAIAAHADKPWRIRRVKKLRAGLIRALSCNDRVLLARYLGGYTDAIDSACRVLEMPELPNRAVTLPMEEAA